MTDELGQAVRLSGKLNRMREKAFKEKDAATVQALTRPCKVAEELVSAILQASSRLDQAS